MAIFNSYVSHYQRVSTTVNSKIWYHCHCTPWLVVLTIWKNMKVIMPNLWKKITNYPLVMTNIAIENDHL